jgi:ribosomal protein S18 acetylase RimI-like enzyme
MKYDIIAIDKKDLLDAWGLIEKEAREALKYPSEGIEYFKKGFFEIQDKKGSPAAFIVRKEGKVTGICVGAPPEGGVGTMIWLVVAPQFRTQGIGKALFDHLCGYYRGLGCHKIKLTAPNKEAIKFYQGRGMTVEGEHPSHWWGMHVWSLGKQLREKPETI